MRTTPRSESEAQKVSKRTLLKPGWLPARITEDVEKVSKAGNDTIELSVSVAAAQGDERTFRDWLTDSNMGAAKLRSCCNAVGALDRYEDRSRKIRLGRRVVVPALAVWLLAGCTTGGQVPQWSARPGYYAPQSAPYYVAPQQAAPAQCLGCGPR